MKFKTPAYLIISITLICLCSSLQAEVVPFTQTQNETQQQPQQPETTPQQPDSARSSAAPSDTTGQKGQSDISTFWEMYQHGGNIAYVIMGVLVVGVLIIVAKTVELSMDWKSSTKLFKMPFRDLNTIEDILAKSKKSYLKEILQHILNFYKAGHGVNNIQVELTSFKHTKYEQFDSYQGWLSFLSDSAGALGLLGTVWGVFQTFFGGNLDNEKILDGMGVALITTLFGLIVSLAINLGSTKLSSSFNKRMELILDAGSRLRLFLMDIDGMHKPVQHRQRIPVAPAEDGGTKNGGGVDLEKLVESLSLSVSQSIEKTMGQQAAIQRPAAVSDATGEYLSILLVDEPPAEISTGEAVNKALCIGVVDENKMPVLKAKVIFETDGELYLDRNQRKVEKYTDKNGQVLVNLHGGEHVGSAELHYRLEQDESASGSVQIDIVAGKAEKIALHRGNHQAAKAGKGLRDSLQVSVQDQFGNPVSGTDVLYKLLEGEGAFNGGHHDHTVRTDPDGFAEAEFSFGQQPGLHRVQAAIKNGRSRPVEFTLFSEAENE